MILQIAWKNIWRNKLRSTVVITSIAVGLLAGILSVSVMNGAIQDRVDSAIRIEVSSIQMHHPDYLNNGESSNLILNADSIIAEIRKVHDVEAVSGRLKLEVMINSGHGPRGVYLYGIDPEIEKTVSQVHAYIDDSSGSWFASSVRNPIVISARLAEKLKVGLNSKIQLDAITQNGDAIASVFRIVGIFHTSNSMFDEVNVYVKKTDLIDLIGFQSDEVHEIAILTKDIMKSEVVENSLRNKFTTYKIDSSAVLTLHNNGVETNLVERFKSKISDTLYSYVEFSKLMHEWATDVMCKNQVKLYFPLANIQIM